MHADGMRRIVTHRVAPLLVMAIVVGGSLLMVAACEDYALYAGPVHEVQRPTFVVNLEPVACYQMPILRSRAMFTQPTGTIQAMEAFIHTSDGLWYREKERKCWTRTDPGPVRVFTTEQEAAAFVASLPP